MRPNDFSLRNNAAGSSRMSDRNPHGRGDDEERERRRREWMIQQEREREHERLKRKKIEEYERKRKAEEKANSHRGRSSNPSTSRDTGESSTNRRRDEKVASTSRNSVMSQNLFKGPEGTKIDVEVLRRIKVDIHRNIPVPEPSNNVLQREIVDPEDVKLKRREAIGRSRIARYERH